ncbi:Uncharacterised protein [Candidatus Burarchaeum australiense]|nr:Uncharacterised protein [Candidatus Burarchaeum australiense]
MKRHEFEFELKRKAIHMGIGIAILLALYLLPVPRADALAYVQAAMLLVLTYLLIVIDRRAKGKRTPPADYFIDSLERKSAPPAQGALWYVVGTIIALTFISSFSGVAAAIFILAIADAISTLAGIWGTHPLPYNKKKTVEGTVAFFITGLASCVFIGPAALPLSLLTSIIESLDQRLDDNLTIPIACVIFFRFVPLA